MDDEVELIEVVIENLEEFYKAMDLVTCEECRFPGMKPPHFASPNCGGKGRRWDPETQQLVGTPHCSCDSCF